MEAKPYKQFAICLGLIAVTFGALSIPRTIRGNPEAPVDIVLPETVGGYTAVDLLFCQNDTCARQVEIKDVADGNKCPHCGGALDPISLGEHNLLPAGTPIARRMYRAANGRNINVTMVFSGLERRSIHKPQVCLQAQGHIIRDESTVAVDIPGRDPLDIRVLDISSTVNLPSGKKLTSLGLYTYWFFNPEFETCYHNERLARMAADNIFRSYRPRWAYVIVSTSRLYEDEQRDLQTIRDFIPRLMPTIEALQQRMLAAEQQGPTMTELQGEQPQQSATDNAGGVFLTHRATKKSSDN